MPGLNRFSTYVAVPARSLGFFMCGTALADTPGSPSAAVVPGQLVQLRASIDNLDAAIIHLLAERFRVTREVGQLKAEQSLPPSDAQREARQVARLRRLASEAGLEPHFAEKFHAFVVAEVVRHH